MIGKIQCLKLPNKRLLRLRSCGTQTLLHPISFNRLAVGMEPKPTLYIPSNKVIDQPPRTDCQRSTYDTNS